MHNYSVKDTIFDLNGYQIASIRAPVNVQLNDINCFYGAHQVLFDIMLDCPQGETLVLLGPSGTGKSSLLRVLNLLEMPRSGMFSIVDNHFDFTKTPSDKTICDLRHNVDIVFQQYNLWPRLTVQRNLIGTPCRILGLSKDQALARVERLPECLRLEPHSDRHPLHFSGGQQQRVVIVRALIMGPQVLLFDEPTATLDLGITAQVISIIRELTKTNITQVIVTHEVEMARRITNRVMYMENGHIIEQGDTSCLTKPQTEALRNYPSH